MFSALKAPENLWKIYLCIATVTVFALCILMPPFEVNDEFQHFFRSYQVSDGILIGRARGGVAGGYLPASLSQLVLDIVGSLQLYKLHPVIARPIGQTLSYLSIPLNASSREFTDFSATVLYSPLGYLPQAFGIWIARLCGAGPLGCFYAARFLNGAFAILITAYALRIAPFARYALFCVALLPTVLSLDGSVSQDATIISSIVLFLALCLRSYERRYWSRFDTILAVMAGLIFSISKLAYAPILFLAFAPIIIKNQDFLKQRLILPWLILILCMTASLAWIAVSHPLMVWHQYHNYPDRQLVFVVTHPTYFFDVIFSDLKTFWLLYLGSATTMFVGWPPEIVLPLYCFVFMLFDFLILPLAEDRGDNISTQKLIYFTLSLILICVFGVLFLLYLSYEPVGGTKIEQAQGRHFIPVFPLALIALSIFPAPKLSGKVFEFARLAILATLVLTSVVLVQTIVQDYRLF
jgi:uncharacterized membrane protein